jgi:hypothetical protein
MVRRWEGEEVEEVEEAGKEVEFTTEFAEGAEFGDERVNGWAFGAHPSEALGRAVLRPCMNEAASVARWVLSDVIIFC